MPIVQRKEDVPYSALQMYTLVDDVERYTEFLPWCQQAEVLSRTDDEVRATLHLVKAGFRKSFTTCNRLQPGKMIEIRLINGPFKLLEGFWTFESLADEGSRVSLNLEFEFAQRWLGLAFQQVFYPIANNFVNAFCRRAEEIYG